MLIDVVKAAAVAAMVDGGLRSGVNGVGAIQMPDAIGGRRFRLRLLRTKRQIQSTKLPDGRKSLLIYGISVKPRNKKYFAFPEGQISATSHASRPTQRGVGHRHNEGRGAVDVEVPVTIGADAYGKDVWS